MKVGPVNVPVGKSLLVLGGFATTVVVGAWIEKTWKDYKAEKLEKQLKAEFMESEYECSYEDETDWYDIDPDTGEVY